MFDKFLTKKSDAKASSAVTLDKTEDDLGPYPRDVNNSPSRSSVLERALRNVTIVAVILGLTNVAMICFLIAVFPLKQVYPYLVKFDDQQQQVVQIEPLAIDAPAIDYVSEDNVRDYVNLRHSFTPISSAMDAQWGPDSRLASMTLPEVYERFSQAMVNERERMMTQGYTRNIDIQSVTKLTDTTWRVDFQTEDSLGGAGGTLTADPTRQLAASGAGNIGIDQNVVLRADLTPAITTQNWVATMTIDYMPQQVSYDNRLLNPLGFVVTDYSVTSRKD